MDKVGEVQQAQEIKPTAAIFAMLALRAYRLDQSVGIRRVTPRVALLLDCYLAHRQREIEALSPLDQMRYTLTQTRAEVKALSEAAQASNDLATVAATLARVELLTGYVQFLSERLEELAFAGVGAEGVSPEGVADA